MRPTMRFVRSVALSQLLLVIVLGHSAWAESGHIEAQQGYMPAAKRVQSPLLKNPPKPTPERLQAINRVRARGPFTVPTPIDSTVRLDTIRPAGPESTPQTTTNAPAQRSPGAFTVFQNTPLNDAATNNQTLSINEPSLGVNGNVVFYTGNTYAAVSGDGGRTFSYIDPADNFPADGTPDPIYGGFCCDQVAYYEPSRDAMFWALLYSDNGMTNTIRIAVAANAQAVLNNSWYLYDFAPTIFGLSDSGLFLDFPDLSVSNNNLYLTCNVFEINPVVSRGSIIARLPLTQLSQGTTLGFSYYVTTDRSSLRCTQGATSTMYWGTHNTNTSIRIYRWDEGSGTISWNDVNHAAYATGTMSAPGPDGRDWAGRADDRVLAAWVADSVIGFMWNTAQGGSFPYPHVQVCRFKEADRSLINQTQVWSTGNAWLYPSVHPNDRGHVGGTIAFGGGSLYPSANVWIADDFNGGAFAPLENYQLSPGTSGPASNGWGDYLTSRRNTPFGNTWSATAFAQIGGPNNADVVPRYAWFGRERDCPTLSAPTVSCTPGMGTIRLDWNPVVGATTYCILRDDTLLTCVADTTWIDTVGSGVQHCYVVSPAAGPCPATSPSTPVCCTALAPPNDDCSTCLPISGNVTDLSFSNRGATTDGPDESGFCDFFGYTHIESDVWFCWTAECTGDATISLCGSSFDTKLAVYNQQTCPPAPGPLACNEDYCGLQSQVTVPVTAGASYRIRVGGFEGAQGEGLLNISMSNVQVVCPPWSTPENEPCGADSNGGCNATPPAYASISCGETVCGNVWYDGTTRDTDWYLKTFATPTTVIWSARADFPVQLNVIDLNGGCGSEFSITFAEGSPCEITTVTTSVGIGTYAFFIAPRFDIDTLLCADGPWDYYAWLTCNDECADCTPLSGEVTDQPFSNIGATTDGPDEPAACDFFGYSQIDSDVWFCWQAGCDGDVTVSLCGSEYNTKLAVYKGGPCPPASPLVACNEDACGLQSEVTFTAVAGTEYRFRVGGFIGDQGQGFISVHYDTAPANDSCSAAVPLSGQVIDLPFSTCGATTDGPDEPGACNFVGYTQIGSDVWYSYTAVCDGNLTVSLCGSDYDTKLAIYKNQPCPPAAGALACNDDDTTCAMASSVTIPVTNGENLLIRIGGFVGFQGNGLLNITNDGAACCDCSNHGDANDDGFIDAVDVQYAIDAVFFNGINPTDPLCPSDRLDVNCDGTVDAVDIQWLIDFVFLGGIPPCDPCTVP